MTAPLHIVYVADTRLPTEKAHGLALMKLCEALAGAGARVEVVAPRLLRLSHKDPYAYYGAAKRFPITRVPSIDLHPLRFARRTVYLIQMLSFSLAALLYCAWRYRSAHVVYLSHDYIPLYALSFLSTPFYYDIHHFPGGNFMYRRVMRRACGFAVQTRWKVDELARRYGIPDERIVYWPNGTDVERFAPDEGAADARKRVGLPAAGPVALYAGQFFAWKGVDTFLKARAEAPEQVAFVLVGGSPEDRARLLKDVSEARDPRVTFVPWVAREEVPHWLAAADLLILPNTGREKVSRYYTSPMKLFEYMAAGRPIIASDLPSIREILSEETAYLVPPDDPAALAKAITEALAHPGEARRRAAAARRAASSYTWAARARALLPHLSACVARHA